MARLGDICTVNPKIPNLDDRLRVSFVPMNKITENGEIDSSECRTFLEVKKGFTYFQNNDILFPKITPCMENGKGALAISLKNGIGFGSTEFHVLRPIPTVAYGKWLYYVTVWDVFRKECEKHMTGSAGQKRVPKAFIENFELQVPSLEQQYHIVTVLDKVSNLIFLRKQQLAKLDELVKARFVEMFGEPVHNSKGLPTKKLCDIGSLERGRSKHRPRNAPELLNGPYPLIQTGDVGNANLYITTYQSTYSEAGLRQSKMWDAGTLCITIAANIAQL